MLWPFLPFLILDPVDSWEFSSVHKAPRLWSECLSRSLLLTHSHPSWLWSKERMYEQKRSRSRKEANDITWSQEVFLDVSKIWLSHKLRKSHPVSVCQVLQLVSHENHRPLVILEKLENSFLHQVIAQVDVQGREWVVLGQGELEGRWAYSVLLNMLKEPIKRWEREIWPRLLVEKWGRLEHVSSTWFISLLFYLFNMQTSIYIWAQGGSSWLLTSSTYWGTYSPG